MKQIKKIFSIGGSLVTSINPEIIEYLDLREDDLLEIDVIRKVIPIKLREYKCRVCGHIFTSDEEIPYCTACGEEQNLKITDEEPENE